MSRVDFDPQSLGPEASLNRTRIAALPGAVNEWIGRPAGELLSRQAFEDLHADAAQTFGQRLAHLIATLSRGPASTESGWREAYLRHWMHVDRVWLGGGLAAALGPELAQSATAELQRLTHAAHAQAVAVQLAPNPSLVPLLGSARTRHRSPPSAHAVVLDFGHSEVKRAIASTNTGGELYRLEVLPSIAIPQPQTPNSIGDFFFTVVAETYRFASHHYPAVDSRILVSVASYLTDGWPAPSQSLYAALRQFDAESLGAALRARTAAALEVTFLHDGTAAARAITESEREAVIHLGTHLGVGLGATFARLPLAPDFKVEPLPGTSG
jgi:hypothetical protein